MNIVVLEKKDIEKIISQSRKEGLVFCKNTNYYGIIENNNLVAITGILLYSNKAIFKNHYVLSEYRGNGYFKKLLDYSISIIKEKGIKKIEATCTNMSIKEYLKRGAKIIKEYKNYKKILLEL